VAAACSVPSTDFAAPVCGNGQIEVGEDCDPGEHATDFCLYGELSCRVCNAACRDVPGVASYCGDLRVDPEVEACDDGNLRSWDGCKSDCSANVLTYAKASNTNANDIFGYSVAISADGTTLAVGAYGE